MELIVFIVLGGLALISAVMVVWRTNPVISALSLAFNLVAIAGLYLLLNAQFIALLQVIVYGGAIMVLILFVIMLLNLPDRMSERSGLFQRWLGPALAAGFVAILGWALLATSAGSGAAGFEPTSAGFGSVSSVGRELFGRFFYAFEAISLLLVVAMVGSVLLAKRKL